MLKKLGVQLYTVKELLETPESADKTFEALAAHIIPDGEILLIHRHYFFDLFLSSLIAQPIAV